MGPSTLASCALLIARALEDRRIDADSLFRRVGLPVEHLRDPNARVSADTMRRIWAACVEATGDPCFGLEVGRKWHPTSFHALGYAALASASLREALGYLVRYCRVVTTGAAYYLTDRDSEVDLALEKNPSNPRDDSVETRVAVQAGLAAVATLCRDASGRRVALHRVAIRQADEGCAARLVNHFGCPVLFGADSNSITFLADQLDAPLSSHNVELLRLNRRLVADRDAALDGNTLSARVRHHIVRLLPSGTIDQETIAKAVQMSSRTLQRKLLSEGVSFRQLVDETRHGLAQQYLGDSTLSSAEVAYLLGFSETSSLSRALRRWRGRSSALTQPVAFSP